MAWVRKMAMTLNLRSVAAVAFLLITLSLAVLVIGCQPEPTFEDGYQMGYDEGYAEGCEEGHAEGITEGQERFQDEAVVVCPFCRREFAPADYDAFVAP